MLTFTPILIVAVTLPSCTPSNNKMADLAKSLSERGASVGFTDETFFVSYGQTLPTGMPDDVELFHATGEGAPSNSTSELRKIVSNRESGQIEVFSRRDADDVRKILGEVHYEEISRSNDWTMFRFGKLNRSDQTGGRSR